MSNFYKRHIFFCNNIRNDGKQCCSENGAKEMYRYAKDKCRANGSLGVGRLGVVSQGTWVDVKMVLWQWFILITFGINILMKRTLTRYLNRIWRAIRL